MNYRVVIEEQDGIAGRAIFEQIVLAADDNFVKDVIKAVNNLN